MFAFCKSMLGLPASYRSMPRDKTLDYFSHLLIERQNPNPNS